MKNKLILFSILFLSISVFSVSKEFIDTRSAQKIMNSKGILEPAEVLTWDAPKEIPKDWATLDNNQFFSFSYPKCFNIEPDGGEDDLKLAPYVDLIKTEKCPFFVKYHGFENLMSITFEGSRYRTLKGTSGDSYHLKRQKITLNGMEARSFIGLADDYDSEKKVPAPALRWQVFVSCKNRIFGFTISNPPGDPSLAHVNKNDYEWPEYFKEIVSTFQCKEEKIEKPSKPPKSKTKKHKK